MNTEIDELNIEEIPFVNSESERLNTIYQSQCDESVKPGNGPLFLPGRSDQVVLMIHGFIGSTFELTTLAKDINQGGEGPSVYLPLLEGFGSSTRVANHCSCENWKSTVRTALEVLSQEFKNISLAGFSLGGGLITDLILDRSIISEGGLVINSPVNSTINSLVLMAPYYAMYSPLPVSSGLLKWFSKNLLGNKYGINLKTLYSIARIRDLKTVVKNSNYYNTAFPLSAVGEIAAYSKELKQIDKDLKSRIPALLTYSEADQTVNLKLAKNIVSEHFSNLTTLIIAKKYNIPHQFIAPDVNPEKFELTSQSIRDFIITHF